MTDYTKEYCDKIDDLIERLSEFGLEVYFNSDEERYEFTEDDVEKLLNMLENNSTDEFLGL